MQRRGKASLRCESCEMGCSLLQDTRHTPAEPPRGSADTVMSQQVMEQLNNSAGTQWDQNPTASLSRASRTSAVSG